MIFAVLYGGDSYARERSIFKFIVTKPNSNVTTILRVWAENEEEARENVGLNGWQIITPGDSTGAVRGQTDSAPQTNQTQTAQTQAAPASEHSVTVTKVGKGDIQPTGTMSVKDGSDLDFKLKPEPCETLEKLVVNGELVDVTDSYKLKNIVKDTYVVAVFKKNGNECSKNNVQDSDLKEVAVIYFDLGKFKTHIPKSKLNILHSLSKNKSYVIIGHTDDVRVLPNVEYKDNYQLSTKRAKFVKSKLNISKHIKIMGMGPAYPVAPNKKNGQPLNRRAVIYERR